VKDAHTIADAPRRHLGMAHATVLALGMILTTDTLKTAPTVALSIGTWHFYGAWVLGGLVSMIGAFCYVEMATAFPDPGGDYSFLRKAYGPAVGWLFAWSRFSIMHTGWMALMAFMFADYAGDLFGLSHLGRALFALATVAALMGLNLLHVRRGFLTQAGLVVLVMLGFAAVVAAAVKLGLAGQLPHAAPVKAAAPTLGKFSVALIYIFLAYGGWSDAATLSAEVRSDRRGMLVAIMGSLALLMVIYLALNAAMMIGLGPAGLAASSAPAADLMGRAFGPVGKTLIVAVVGVSAIASINSTLIVGARTTYAAARDVPRLAAIGRWDGGRGIPARAVLAEGGFALLLVIAGGFAQSGFNAMVDYMTPVYWFFVMLSMGALIILRRRHPDAPRPVRTPFFPLFPAVFGLISLYMLGAGLLELGLGALYGAGVMAVGAGLMLLVRIGQGRAKAPEGEGRA
jgi:basic amino acid/polyamine antiporter, APA family